MGVQNVLSIAQQYVVCERRSNTTVVPIAFTNDKHEQPVPYSLPLHESVT